MDPRERFPDPQEHVLIALDAKQSMIYTNFPGIVQSVNTVALTCVVQPAIQGIVRQKDGTLRYTNMPLLPDVPLIIPHGGGYALTFPVQPGDECMVFIANRCIDSWWQSGGIQKPIDFRMHDLSDGFALIGPYSQPNVISGYATTTAQFRTNDGTIVVELDQANNRLHLKAPTIWLDTQNLSLNSGATVTPDLGVGNVPSYLNHTHPVGGGNSGPPNAGT